MTTRKRLSSRRTFAILACLLILGLVASFILMLPRNPNVTLPNPNAVDTLVEAGRKVRGLESLIGDTPIAELADVEAMSQFMKENEVPFAEYQQALEQGCVPVIDYDKGITEVSSDDGLRLIRTATYLPTIAARLAILEGRPNDAAVHYAGLFTLGRKYGGEGLLIHTQLSFAFERMGLQGLLEIATSLDDATRAETLVVLESNSRQLRDYEQIADRERVLVNNEHGAIQATAMRFMTGKLLDASYQACKDSDAQIMALYSEVVEKLQPTK